jgi:predicted nucleic acid-binding protein
VLIFLDTTLLWILVHPAAGQTALDLRRRLHARMASGDELAVAEICDYEARRELIRRKAAVQIANLDKLISTATYVPIDTPTMRDAATLWARVRNAGQPTASNQALDGDIILAAQAQRQKQALVATQNVRHLRRLCSAIAWRSL